MGGPGHTVKAEFNSKAHKRAYFRWQGLPSGQRRLSIFYLRCGRPFLDRQYTVFGEVVSGMDVVDKIVNQPRDRSDNPNERIEMR